MPKDRWYCRLNWDGIGGDASLAFAVPVTIRFPSQYFSPRFAFVRRLKKVMTTRWSVAIWRRRLIMVKCRIDIPDKSGNPGFIPDFFIWKFFQKHCSCMVHDSSIRGFFPIPPEKILPVFGRLLNFFQYFSRPRWRPDPEPNSGRTPGRFFVTQNLSYLWRSFFPRLLKNWT